MPVHIPDASARFSLDDGRPSREWYAILARLAELLNETEEVAAEVVAAEDVTYDNATSGLTAEEVQAAIDEVEDRVDTIEAAPAPVVEVISSGSITAGATEVDIALGTYDLVEVDLMGIEPNTDASSIFSRFSQDGGGTFLAGASDYGWALANNGAGTSDNADTEITMTGGIGNAAGEFGTLTARIFRPSAASFVKAMTWVGMYVDSAGGHTATHGGGRLLANTAAVTHVRFLLESSSTIDAGHYAARGYRFS